MPANHPDAAPSSRQPIHPSGTSPLLAGTRLPQTGSGNGRTCGVNDGSLCRVDLASRRVFPHVERGRVVRADLKHVWVTRDDGRRVVALHAHDVRQQDLLQVAMETGQHGNGTIWKQSAWKRVSMETVGMETGQHGNGSPWKPASMETGQHGNGRHGDGLPWQRVSMATGQHGNRSAWKLASMETGQHGNSRHGDGLPWQRVSMATGQHGNWPAWKRASMETGQHGNTTRMFVSVDARYFTLTISARSINNG